MDTFDVLMVLNFFDVLFGFRCCDFRSSDLSQKFLIHFQLIRMAKNFQHNLNSHLMTPIQRVTRYPLLLQVSLKGRFLRAVNHPNHKIWVFRLSKASKIEYNNFIIRLLSFLCLACLTSESKQT
jgi:hypothetical protein